MVLWLLVLSYPTPTPHSDAWDYAQLARNVAEGEGFVSDFTYPVAYGFDTAPPFATLWRLPLYPLLLAVPFQFESLQSVETLRWVSGVFFVLGALLTGLVARRYLRQSLAWLAVVLYLLSPQLIQSMTRGLSEPLYVSLVLMACLSLSRETLRWDMVGGFLLGLSWVTRSNTLFLLPGVAIWLLLRPVARKQQMLFLAAVFLSAGLVCLPWWIRNALAVGDATLNISSYLPSMFTPSWPGWSLFRTLVPEGAPVPVAPWDEILAKGLRNLWSFGVVGRAALLGPLLLCYYWGLWRAFRFRFLRPEEWRFAVFVGISETVLFIVLSFVNPDLRIYSCLLPLLIVVCLLPFHVDRGSAPRIRSLLLVAVILFMAASMVRLGFRAPEHKWPMLTRVECEDVRAALPQDGIILSDLADYLAWEIERSTMVLPTPESIELAPDFLHRVAAIHLSPEAIGFLARESASDSRWEGHLQGTAAIPWVGDLILETTSGHQFYSVNRVDESREQEIIDHTLQPGN